MTYSALDRCMHRIAFGSPDLQQNLAALEDLFHGGKFADIELQPPIFITGLPRSGTTILLETLAKLPDIATHRYCDMPFIMSPVLWNGLARKFRKNVALRQRAHDDGISIDINSPEAFEEILWLHHWPDKYSENGIALWPANPESDDFKRQLSAHMRKVISARGLAGGRYASKNNANIARIDLLAGMFPQARIVVPFREPFQHAKSMLRQHLNFQARHSQDAFSKRYMSDLGHFEFGALHKPILFPGLESELKRYSDVEIEYWLAYWLGAYRALRAKSDKVIFVSLERLRRDPAPTLRRLCRLIGLDCHDAIELAVGAISPSAEHDRRAPDCALDAEVIDLYGELLAIEERTN